MTYKRKYMAHNKHKPTIGDKRFAELVLLGETCCRTFINDFTNEPSHFYNKLENAKHACSGIARTQIGISIKPSKNDKVRALEEKIIVEAALNLFTEFEEFLKSCMHT